MFFDKKKIRLWTTPFDTNWFSYVCNKIDPQFHEITLFFHHFK